MKKNLESILFGVAGVKRPGAIPMGPRRGVELNPRGLQMGVPGIHGVEGRHKDADMVEDTHLTRRRKPSRHVKRQIVSPGSQIHILRIRTPLDLKPHDADVETLHRLEAADVEGQVPEPKEPQAGRPVKG